jgi:hypothetical protein
MTIGKIYSYQLNTMNFNQNYTHTVFAGAAFTQQCGDCHPWSEYIYSVHQSGNYDFDYVSMVIFDENGQLLNREARNWSRRYSIYAFPMSIFDGDYQRIHGNEQTLLVPALDACGNRTVENITADLTLIWLENATFNASLTIQNHENTQYNGLIDIFITEIVSRYNTSLGVPFHYGFLDFAFFNESITIDPGGTFTNYTIWNGNEHKDNHGNNYGDITLDNMRLSLVVYNATSGYVDESISKEFPNIPPTAPSNPTPADGEVDVSITTDLSWTCTDPDGDSNTLTYDVYFGTSTPPPLVGSNITTNSYNPGPLNHEVTYYWKIRAWDYRGASNESPIWSFTTIENMPPNAPSNPNPENGQTNVNVLTDLSWICTDPEGGPLTYDVYFGNYTPPPLVVSNISLNIYDPGTLNFSSTYYWKIVAWDIGVQSNESPIWIFYTRSNVAPDNPDRPSGPYEGETNTNIEFSTTTNDSDGDWIYYWFDWGNGENSGWIGPYQSNENVYERYSWSEPGDYEIRVKARDNYFWESNWSDPWMIHIFKQIVKELEVVLISGGLFRTSALIQNIGTEEVKNVNWNISFVSGLVFWGDKTSGTIKSIPPGGMVDIYSGLVIGFGKTTIFVTAEKDGWLPGIKAVNSYLLGIYIWIFS